MSNTATISRFQDIGRTSIGQRENNREPCMEFELKPDSHPLTTNHII